MKNISRFFLCYVILSFHAWGTQNQAIVENIDGIELLKFQRLDSTQSYARREYNRMDPLKWRAVCAEEQTEGVAQRNRSWASPPAVGLYVTFMIPYPMASRPQQIHIPHIVTISISQVLENIGITPVIKWVNDLLLNNKKICGTLCENKGQIAEGFDALLVGVGLNVNTRQADLSHLDQTVSSLMIETDNTWDKEPILRQLCLNLKSNLEKLLSTNDFSPFLGYLNERLAYRDEEIIVIDKDVEFTDMDHLDPSAKRGRLEGLGDNGCLLLKHPNGKIEKIYNGRIRRLKDL